MSQSPKMSFVESCTNVAIGYGVAVASQCVIFPLFGLYTPLQTNLKMGAWFTVISIVRSYAVRRLFNKKEMPCAVESNNRGGRR
jgi:hypothetical protein